MNELAQFLNYVVKVFTLNRVARGVRDARPYGQIPTRPLFLSLLLGVVARAKYTCAGVSDHRIGAITRGEWWNYSRTLDPKGSHLTITQFEHHWPSV